MPATPSRSTRSPHRQRRQLRLHGFGCPVVVGQTFSANFPTFPFVTGEPAERNQRRLRSQANPDRQGAPLLHLPRWHRRRPGYRRSRQHGTVAPTAPLAAISSDRCGCGDIFVGGYTDSPFFLCPAATRQPHTAPMPITTSTTSSDAFVVKIPSASANPLSPAALPASITRVLYGGFGEEFAHGSRLQPDQPNGLPGRRHHDWRAKLHCAQQHQPPGYYQQHGQPVPWRLHRPAGPDRSARGGFVVAFDATTLVRPLRLRSRWPVSSPAGLTTWNQAESITGIAAEGGRRRRHVPVAPATWNSAPRPARPLLPLPRPTATSATSTSPA